MDYAQKPLRILQFGEGNFLRAFADNFIDRANEAGCFSGSVAIVKPRGDKPLTQFSRQDNRYTVCVRGADETSNRTITSVRHALNPNLEPELYEHIILSDDLRFVISNTTEAGIHFDPADSSQGIPCTYPGRVTKLLYQRFIHFHGDNTKGLYLLPCELNDHNGELLRDCVLQYARLWQLPEEFLCWVEESCWFLDTLVDRIVSGFPTDSTPYFQDLGWNDNLLTVCEPFCLWVIQEKGNIRQEFPLDKADSGILFVPDVTPYKERKVRLLNGAHTAMTGLSLLLGKECVDESINDPALQSYLDALFDQEIIPAFTTLPKEELEQFAADVKERFRNPHLHHRWSAIRLNAFSKFAARLMPTVRQCSAVPQRIALALAALIELYCVDPASDDSQILAFFAENASLSPDALIRKLISTPIFGLSELADTPFQQAVILWLEQIRTKGALCCVSAFSAALRIHPTDNVAVCKYPLAEGDTVCVDGSILAGSSIPMGHKIAVDAIRQGEPIIKYGFPIGVATGDIAPGEHVHSHNMTSALTGHETFTYTPYTPALSDAGAVPTFSGFRRSSGKVGIRNEIWIIPTVGCINSIAQTLAQQANSRRPEGVDAVVALTHPYGCSQLGDDHTATCTILADLANHPNAGGVLLLGLGCENNQLNQLLPLVHAANLRTLVCQETSDELSAGAVLLDELMDTAAKACRQEIPASELVIGLKCGGSDAFSGITANVLTGSLSDRLCAMGGSVVMGEVPEMFGAEASLLPRCANEEVFRQADAMIRDFKAYYLDQGLPVCENPSPGNRAGGITTLEEKSMGCTQKCGRAPITDVQDYGGVHRTRGVTLLRTPGNDLVASTALAAAGCHMVLFTTGRGTPYGTCVPTVKLSTNTALAQKKNGWIDFDAGTLLGIDTLSGRTDDLLQYVLSVASGCQTKNEQLNCREIAIFKNGVTL